MNRVDKSCIPEARDFIKKETPTQVLFCEFCEIFKNTSLIEHLANDSAIRNYVTKI